MNADQFLIAFPEFRGVSVNVIAAKLAAASGQMGGPDGSVWPAFGVWPTQTLTDIAQSNLAADILISSPAGSATLLSQVKGTGGPNKTKYREVYDQCEVSVACGGLVAGMGCFPGVTQTAGAPVLQTGVGTVSVTNGLTAVTFSNPQTFQAGTLFVFYSQPGVFYQLVNTILGSTSALISAPYSGTTAAASTWAY